MERSATSRRRSWRRCSTLRRPKRKSKAEALYRTQGGSRPGAWTFVPTNESRSKYPRLSPAIRCLHRLIWREELDRAVRQIRSQLCAHLAEELAVNNGDHCKDGFG